MKLQGFVVGLTFLAACLCSASDWRLSQLNRRVWQIEDGLPHNYVTAITTDENGYLLLGTQSGIARFDGMRFTPYERLGGVWIYSFLTASDGALWVGGYQSGLHRVENGKMQSWSAAEGISEGTVYSMLEDRKHRVWLVSSSGLMRIEQNRPQMVLRGTDVDGYAWQSMTEDDSGAIWFAAQQGLFRVTAGEAKKISLTGAQGLPVTIYHSSEKRQLFLGTTTGFYSLKCSPDSCEGNAYGEVHGPVVGAMVASDHSLWVATWGNGIYRVDGSRVEQFSTREGLADDFVRVLSEDREHNLWAGTRSGGLTRFRQTVLKPVGIPEGLGGNYASAVIGDGADGLWLGTWRSGLFHWRNGKMTQQPLAEPSLGMLINALAMDGSQDLWIGTFHGLWRLRHGHQTADRIPLPDGDANVTSLLWTRDSALWIGRSGAGLARFDTAHPGPPYPAPVLERQTLTGLIEDREGRIWVATKSGLWRIAATPDRKIEPISSKGVTALGLDYHGRIWVAEQGNGIRVYGVGGPVQVRYAGLPVSTVYVIASDAQDGIWFGTGRGLARAPAREVEEFLDGQRPRLDLVNYGISEGMRTIECRIGAQPSSWKLADGSVWLPTAKGFVAIGSAPTESLPPPRPLIENIQVDGKKVSTDVPMRLPAGGHELTVNFTAIRLGRAERVQFRYRLQGLEQNWVESGSDRSVRYSNLRPGKFELLVAARDPGGVWSDPTSSASIEQLPFVYQTGWFRSLIVLALGGLVALIYRFRVHAVRRRYRAVLEERNRIAREWHDTLLAGLAAASWQLDVASEQCRDTNASASIQSAKGMVRYCRDEARRAIGDLRDEPVSEVSLTDSVREAIRQLTDGTSLRSRFEIDARLPAFSQELSSDLLRICQEAAANAVHHAHASELVVRLGCTEGKVLLSVADDGVGMDASTIDHPPHGHYGLLGMQERARRFGGNLYLTSEPGKGTTVLAVVPLVN